MIYLYGLLHPDAAAQRLDLGALSGVTGPVEMVPTDQGYLIYGPGHDGEILPKRRFLLAHTRVLETVNVLGTLLPMRFGMSAPDLAEVTTMMAREAAAITAQFARLEGAIELGVRIDVPRDVALDATLAAHPALAAERDRLASMPRPPHFQAAELGRQLAEALDRRRNAAQKALVGALKPQMRDYVLRRPEADTQVLCLDALIPRLAEADFVAAVEAATRALSIAPGGEPQIRLIGPVPAYSFVQLRLGGQTSKAA